MNSPLYKAYKQAKDAGAFDIYLFRLNGTPAMYRFYSDSTPPFDEGSRLLEISAISGGSIYNNATLENNIKVELVTISNQSSLKITSSSTVRTYSLSKYDTLGLLVNAINFDADNKLIDVQAQTNTPWTPSNALTTSGLDFTQGSNEDSLTPDQLYEKLDICYSVLEAFPVSLILPIEAYFDTKLQSNLDIDGNEIDVQKNFVMQLARFCRNKEQAGSGAIGIMQVKPFDVTNTDTIQTSINNLLINTHTKWILEDYGLIDEEMSDLGKYLVVVTAEATFEPGTSEETVGSCGAAFAGLVSSLSPHISPTNKGLYISGSPLYNLTNTQISQLSSKNFVTVYESIRRGLVPSGVKTMTTLETNYSSLSNVRVGQQITRIISEAIDQDFGEEYTPNSIERGRSSIDDALNALVEQRVIANYRVSIVLEDAPVVAVEFVPVGEINSITVSITLIS